MKKFDYDFENEYGYVVVGTEREIRSLYKRMIKSCDIHLISAYWDIPKFNNFKMYGILVNKWDGCFRVINSDMIVRYLMNIK